MLQQFTHFKDMPH